MILDDFPNKL